MLSLSSYFVHNDVFSINRNCSYFKVEQSIFSKMVFGLPTRRCGVTEPTFSMFLFLCFMFLDCNAINIHRRGSIPTIGKIDWISIEQNKYKRF